MTERGYKGIFWGKGCILFTDCGSGDIGIFVKTQGIFHFKCVHFILCELYQNNK